MKPVFWLLLGLLSAMPVCAQSAPVAVTAETLQTHQRYLAGRLQEGQFAAIDSLLATLSRERREFLLLQLLRDIPATPCIPCVATVGRGSGRQGPRVAHGAAGRRFSGAATSL